MKTCLSDSCDRKAIASGMCNSHYARSRKGLDIHVPLRHWDRQNKKCVADGCEMRAKRRFYCDQHYDQQHRGGEMKPYRPRIKIDRSRVCVISGCDINIEYSTLMCKKHESICYQYKLSSIQIQMLWDGGCMICGGCEKLSIDHDHACCYSRKNAKKDYC